MSKRTSDTDPIDAKRHIPETKETVPLPPGVAEQFAAQRHWNTSTEGRPRPDWIDGARADSASRFFFFPLDLLDNMILPYIRGPYLNGRLPPDLTRFAYPVLFMKEEMPFWSSYATSSLTFPSEQAEPTVYIHVPTIQWTGNNCELLQTFQNTTYSARKPLCKWPCLVALHHNFKMFQRRAASSTLSSRDAQSDGAAVFQYYTIFQYYESNPDAGSAVSEYQLNTETNEMTLLTSYKVDKPWSSVKRTMDDDIVIDQRGMCAMYELGTAEETLNVYQTSHPSDPSSCSLEFSTRTYNIGPRLPDSSVKIAFGPAHFNSLWVLVIPKDSAETRDVCLSIIELDLITGALRQKKDLNHMSSEPYQHARNRWNLLVDSDNRVLACYSHTGGAYLFDATGSCVASLELPKRQRSPGEHPRAFEVSLTPDGCLVTVSSDGLAWFF